MRIYLLAIAILICTAADAQIIRAEPFYTAPEAAVSGNLLLDDYPGAAVAYSLRKLDKDYTGSAIRVRRSSDNTEQDIGFVNNYLDTAAMKTFVGNNNGFVTTWYDQSTNGRNLTQTTAANQPRIINAGVIHRENSRVAIYLDGTNDNLTRADFMDTLSNLYISSVSNSTGNNAEGNKFQWIIGKGYYTNVSTYAGSWYHRYHINGLQFSYNDPPGIATTTSSDTYRNTQILFTSIYDKSLSSGTNINLYANGSNIRTGGTTATIVDNNHDIRVGSWDTVNYLIGTLQEILLYTTPQASNRTNIESNINSFYSIY